MSTKTVPASSELFTKTIRGHEFPTLGFGTFELSGNTCRKAVTKALEVGYRHIDTARMYENEKEVGLGIKDSGIQRDDFFLTDKVWWEDLSSEKIEQLPKDQRQIDPDFAPDWDNPEWH